ncbi:MAG: sialate O-acetylesterase [Planctomycetes bacterium]|nr:sialate O-acetylesterase [Planctomycetota bacterium]
MQALSRPLRATLIPIAASMCCTLAPLCAQAAARKPVQVFILMGQSNMVGFGRVSDRGKQGTLEELCTKRGKYRYLVDGAGKWKVRDDVWCVKTTVGQKQGWLQPGFGARNHFIGPELSFGNVVGDHIAAPVLLIKASQGNRSLGWDILPPGSKRFEHGGRIHAGYKDTPASWVEGQPKKSVNWYAGKQYDEFVRDIRAVLDNPKKFYPSYDGRGLELAGFVWWQGHKDQNEAHANRYEQNLVQLIHSLRKEFRAPKAPFVLATIAFGGKALKGHGLTVAKAQLAVSGETGKYPEFRGNVKTVDARRFWRDKSVSRGGSGASSAAIPITCRIVSRPKRANSRSLPNRRRGSTSVIGASGPRINPRSTA